MTVQIPPLATPVPQSTDPLNFAPRADAFLTSIEPFAEAANRQNIENNQLNESTVLHAAAAKSSSDVAMTAIGAAKFDPATTYQAGAQAWSPVNGKVYRRKLAGKSAADPSADDVNWLQVTVSKTDVGLGNVDNTSDQDKPVSRAQKTALDLKETPAGALAQMQRFGIGLTASGAVLQNIDAIGIPSGIHYVPPESQGTRPAGAVAQSLVEELVYNSGTSRQMLHTVGNSSNALRSWTRNKTNTALGKWQEFAFLDAMQTWNAPQAFKGLTLLSGDGTTESSISNATATGDLRFRVSNAGTDTRMYFDSADGKNCVYAWGRDSNVPVAKLVVYKHDKTTNTSFEVDAKNGNVTAGGINFNGLLGLDSATVLNKYERGTFTPVLRGATVAGTPVYVARFGKYVDIGDAVIASGQVQISSKGGMVGDIRIEGFPFIGSNDPSLLPAGSVSFQNGVSGNLLLSLNRNTTIMNIYREVSGTTQSVKDADITDTFRLAFNLIYFRN